MLNANPGLDGVNETCISFGPVIARNRLMLSANSLMIVGLMRTNETNRVSGDLQRAQ